MALKLTKYSKSISLLNSLIFRSTNNSSTVLSTALRSRKSKSNTNNVQYYVDEIKMRTQGGRGGDGMVSFLQDWCNENGGPNGGDGGHGGHVLFLATNGVKGFNHCPTVITAKHGEKGAMKDCNGKNAEHNVIKVPIGTIIKNNAGTVVGDLNKEGMIFVAARGGSGGKGNSFFTSDTMQAPEIAEYGAEGEKNIYTCIVRSMAHVGLLGFPNAGKSTLLRAISRARPKVAPYPFTTLHPHIGVVQYDDYEQVAVADLPGLIPGSHLNKGLGIQFLQHAERCCCLLFIVDVSQSKPWEQIEAIQYELFQFSEELLHRPKVIIANKIDLPNTKDNVTKLKKHFKDMTVYPISARVGTNISVLLQVIRKMYDESQPEPINEENNKT